MKEAISTAHDLFPSTHKTRDGEEGRQTYKRI